MRLPRRSPFHNAEDQIPQLYHLLYPSDETSSATSRQQGVDLVQSVYLPKGGCPVAIECTASLVSCTILDDQFTSISTQQHDQGDLPPHLSLPLRQTLSLSLIRLVNSLSDAMQTGSYARSIAHIAETQLGMPGWFVEFRHRATHEDLPSLEICRSVVGAALGWLEGVYWRPMMSRIAGKGKEPDDHDMADDITTHSQPQAQPSASSSSSSTSEWWKATLSTSTLPSSAAHLLTGNREAPPTPTQLIISSIPTLGPTLKAYKRVSKLIARDESLRGPSRMEMQGLYGDVDRWIARRVREVDHLRDSLLNSDVEQSRVGRLTTPPMDADGDGDAGEFTNNNNDDGISSQQLVLECVFTHLMQPGGLIPLSRTKRAKAPLSNKKPSTAERAPPSSTLPSELLRTWSPLLMYLTRNWEGITAAFVSSLQRTITSQSAHDDDDEHADLFLEDKSYRYTCIAWLIYIVSSFLPTRNNQEEDQELCTAFANNLATDGIAISTACTSILQDCLLSAVSSSARAKALIPVIMHLTNVLRALSPSSSSPNDAADVDQWEHLVQLIQSKIAQSSAAAADVAEDTDMLKGFEDMSDPSAAPQSGSDDTHHIVQDMQQRYEDLIRMLGVVPDHGEQAQDAMNSAPEEDQPSTTSAQEAPLDESSPAPLALPPGWSIPADDEWKPRPIGCF